jgi:ribosomal-protein-serine acetyltransferase
VTPPLEFRAAGIPRHISTPRLVLRSFKHSDAPDLYQATSTSVAEINPFLPWCHPNSTLADARQWIHTADSNWDSDEGWAFAIRAQQTGEFIGGCGLNKIDEHLNANLGYWIKSSAVGLGYASEAARALAVYGLHHLQLMRIEIIMSTANTRSVRVAEKIGATYEGIARNLLILHDLAHDAHVFSMIPADILEA